MIDIEQLRESLMMMRSTINVRKEQYERENNNILLSHSKGSLFIIEYLLNNVNFDHKHEI